jgi:hypothetical protein
MQSSPKRIVSIIVTGAVAALPIIGIWQRQQIFDWWRLRNYTPSAQVAELANSTTLTDDGRHLLYVYHTELQEREAFNESCKFGEKSIVLGCYVSNQGIYIYNVTDERLAGIQEVTAAHEVLHAAYDRLSDSERERIDALTQKTFESLKNQRIKDSIKAYRERDPSVVPNELHSIIGTEVRDIPAELETYYSRYFQDRKAVVGFSEQYEQAFTERKARAAEILRQIESLKAQIEALNASLARTRAELDQEYNSLQAQRSTAEASSFNARVRAYNAKVQSYNAQVQQSYALIDQHNALVSEYNQVVVEEKELIQAIDSRPSTIDTQ